MSKNIFREAIAPEPSTELLGVVCLHDGNIKDVDFMQVQSNIAWKHDDTSIIIEQTVRVFAT